MADLAKVGRSAGARFLPAMESRDFRTLWLASASAGAAAWALIVARGWLVLTLSNSSTWVGLTTFAAMIPLLVVPLLAGFLADRMDRRALLAWAFATNVLCNLALAILAVTGAIHVWHLVLLSLINGMARAVEMTAVQSLLPNLVPRRHLLNAIALNAATRHGARLLGPGLIMPLMATVGPGGAFFLCSAFYALGLIQVLRIRTSSRGVVEPGKGTLGNLLAGLSYVYHHSLIRSIVLIVVFHCALTMSLESLLPVLSRDKLGTGGAGVSYLMMALGSGAFVAVMGVAGMRSERDKGQLLLLTGVASGLALLALAASPNLPLALLSAAVLGAGGAGFMTITVTIVQSIVPDAIRGRVSSIYLLHASGVMAFANLGNGVLADLFGAPLLLTVTGVAFVTVMTASLLGPTLRQVYSRGVPAMATAA